MIILIIASRWTKAEKATKAEESTSYEYPWMRRVLLTSLTFIYGMEVCYKFATNQVIFLLNPCHVATPINIYLLAKSPASMTANPDSWLLKRILHTIHGPMVAVFFPVTNTLFLPCEVDVYWIQHYLILIAPVGTNSV